MPWFTRQNVEFGQRIPEVVNWLALEDDHGRGSKGVQYGVDAYEPKSICEDTLMGTIGSKDAAIEGENGKLDTIHRRCVEYGDNVRSLIVCQSLLAGLEGRWRL